MRGLGGVVRYPICRHPGSLVGHDGFCNDRTLGFHNQYEINPAAMEFTLTPLFIHVDPLRNFHRENTDVRLSND